MIQQFLTGIAYALSGFSLILKKGIRPFVLVPLLINIGVFSLGIWLAYSQYTDWIDKMLGWLPSWLSWLEYLLLPLFAILILIAVYYTFTIVANLLASPFNSLLAERVEQKLNGLPIPESKGYKALVGTIGKTMMSETKKIIYMLKWLPVLLIISFIPVVNFIAPFAWAAFGAWMLSLQYTDYSMGNHQLFIKEELGLLRKNRAISLGFGGTLTLLMMIPVVNFFVMPVGVAGGTAFWVKRLSQTLQTK
ncbi:MAG TPA: sulfate transporter CysZ [Leucothrix sp.]|nr:sulfate transporter CysZ [Leucothrix sp.]HIQ15694.1 sulfate transporter CysZ [Leucothrix sp.]